MLIVTIHRRPVRRGLTLAEVAISALLVGLVMVSALRSVEMSLRTWETTAQTADANGLAKQLLGEIEGLPYEDVVTLGNFGPESGETASPARAQRVRRPG
ncbi:MAG: hypothetical protein R3B90_20685 [Planctomycetaceae bacterium]